MTHNAIRHKEDVKAVSNKAQVPPLLRQRHNAARGYAHTESCEKRIHDINIRVYFY